MYTLIFANGRLNNGPAIYKALDPTIDGDALIIAADGGARHAEELGWHVDLVVGDMDSLQRMPHGAEVHRAPPDKDQTDLELALMLAAERGATQIRVIGATGGRIDQTIGNVMLLALPELRGIDVRLVNGRQTVWLVEKHTAIKGDVGDTLSLLPFGGDAQGVRSEGLRYPLRGETLCFGRARGMSNVMAQTCAEVWVESGRLLAIYTTGRA